MKPMLAINVDWDLLDNKYPFFVQPKIDGVRCLIKDGVAYARSLKPIKNEYIQDYVKSLDGEWNGYDGELIVGDLYDSEVFKQSQSGISTIEGEPNFKLILYDFWNREFSYTEAIKRIGSIDHEKIVPIDCLIGNSRDHISDIISEFVGAGAEGGILRLPNSGYKFGRSTAKEAWLLKVKEFQDAEAKVIGFQEEMQNNNEAVTNELGRTSRASCKENLQPKGTLGSLICSFDGDKYLKPCEITLGTGFTKEERKHIWENQSEYLGKIVTFKYFPTPGYEKPRHLSFKGFRDKTDIG